MVVWIGAGCAAPKNAPATPPQSATSGSGTSASDTIPSGSDATTLEQAIQSDTVTTVRDLLAKGADPNAKQEGTPLLFLTLDKKSPEVAEALLDKGARIDTQDKDGETILLQAVMHSNRELTRVLLDRNADPNQPDRDGDLPLVMAAAQDDARLVKLLLERGANPDAIDHEGDTALRVATRIESPALIALLH